MSSGRREASSWMPEAGAIREDAAGGEPAAARGKGHSDEWYQERCITCSACHGAVNSQAERRGVRCAGCRRWLHRRCRDTNDPAGVGSASAGASASIGASDAASASPSSSGGSGGGGAYFHTSECRAVHTALSDVACKGGLTRFPGVGAAEFTMQLLDLGLVKRLYKDEQKLYGSHVASRRRPQRARVPTTVSSGAEQGGGGGGGGGGRWAPAGDVVGDFLEGLQLLNSAREESAKDLLEDGWAVLLRRSDGQPLCFASFNVYGPDHARLQSLVTLAAERRRGRAQLLVRQLQGLLGGAGVRQLVAAVEQDGPGDPVAAEKLFRRRLGFKDVEPLVLASWRRELPEYHKNLVGSCLMLVKPLTV